MVKMSKVVTYINIRAYTLAFFMVSMAWYLQNVIRIFNWKKTMQLIGWNFGK